MCLRLLDHYRQQQRVAICRAVVNNPKILLADEPLGNLDSKSANEVICLFKDINIKLGKTVILVTHDPTYLDIAHRVFFIKDGKLVDTKINRDIKDQIDSKDAFGCSQHAKELDFMSNHYSKLTETESDFLIRAWQAKNMASLALTGLSADDFDNFRNKVENSLRKNDDFGLVREFLDVNPDQGGLGMDSRAATKITKHLKALAAELKASDDLPRIDSSHLRTAEVEQGEENAAVILRRRLFDELNINLKDFSSLQIIDQAILNRLRGEIDRKELFFVLDNPLSEGGAGLDRRLVDKIVKRLEIWLVGHKG